MDDHKILSISDPSDPIFEPQLQNIWTYNFVPILKTFSWYHIELILKLIAISAQVNFGKVASISPVYYFVLYFKQIPTLNSPSKTQLKFFMKHPNAPLFSSQLPS